MIGTNSFFYIMDYSGNYYRTNKSDQLVVTSGREEAEIFTLCTLIVRTWQIFVRKI
ncbi:MAG: hypothetical protein ACLU1S_09580 [Eubacterium sp.]